MEDNYPKAYKEVMEILNFVPKESVDKIPQTMLDTFNAKMDNNYNFKVDINKSFEEQNLLEETKAIFSNIFRDYWAMPEQKERIEIKEIYDRQKNEEEKKKKYDIDDMFRNRKKENILPVEIKKENFFEKIFNFFKKLFNLD